MSINKKQLIGSIAIVASLTLILSTVGFSYGKGKLNWIFSESDYVCRIENTGSGDAIIAKANQGGAGLHSINWGYGNAILCEGRSQFEGSMAVTKLNVLHDHEAVLIDFGSVPGSCTGANTKGLGVYSEGINSKGTQIGVHSRTSIDAPMHPQKGTAQGYLATVTGWDTNGQVTGVTGLSTPKGLDASSSKTANGLGGRFKAEPETNLNLNTAGTFWVGGIYGEVAGTINTTPTSGAVAGVIGVDNANGTARSYAGYFEGSVNVSSGRLFVSEGSKELRFDASNPDAEIGASSNTITFWHTAVGYNDLIARSFTQASSKRWKRNIEPIKSALKKVLKLRGVSFEWESDKKRDIGLIAEEVSNILPEVVTLDPNTNEAISVNYSGLVSVLVEATKEQQEVIEKQKGELKRLNERLSRLESIMVDKFEIVNSP